MNPTPSPTYRPTWCEIDLGAIEHNIGQVKSLVAPAVKLYICLKADANGCGAIQVARTAERAGVDGLAFGNVDAALECRRAGVSLPILLYPNCLPEAAPVLEANGMAASLSTAEDVDAWGAHARSCLQVFLKLDSGGLRAGALPSQAVEVAAAIARHPRLVLAGVYGHSLATYGKTVEGAVEHQVSNFQKIVTRIEQAGIAIPMRMFSSSELILSHPSADFDAVDPGRLITGVEFPSIEPRRRTWRPAFVGLKSRLVMKKSLADVEPHGSAPPFELRPNMTIGLIPFGWSEGYPRQIGSDATVLINGRRVPVLAPIHSELMRVDLTDAPEASVGDEVVLLGRSGAAEVTVEELARQWGTSSFGLFTRIGRSVTRRYV